MLKAVVLAVVCCSCSVDVHVPPPNVQIGCIEIAVPGGRVLYCDGGAEAGTDAPVAVTSFNSNGDSPFSGTNGNNEPGYLTTQPMESKDPAKVGY